MPSDYHLALHRLVLRYEDATASPASDSTYAIHNTSGCTWLYLAQSSLQRVHPPFQHHHDFLVYDAGLLFSAHMQRHEHCSPQSVQDMMCGQC